MSAKTPKARHARLLSNGFFPPEMPSCFYSERFGANREAVLKAFGVIPSKKKGTPHFHLFKGERAVFHFPRFGREDRRHAYINPISYFYLSKVLSENYVGVRKLNRRSKISIAPAIFDWAGERALIRPAFDARDAQRVTLNAGYELLAEADIAAFFHSVYTHTIPWAIHGKVLAKKKKQDMTMYGNLLDLLVRNAQDGQTIGLPVGPDTSRLLAEIIGTAVDKALQTALKGKRNWSAKQRGGMRFVDDYTFGCSSRQEAEIIVAAVRRCVNEFELELNNNKTSISPTGPFFPAAWKEHVRSLLPGSDADKGSLLQYFYGIEVAVRAHPEANVQKFAIQNARRLFLECGEWRLIEDYLLSSYRQNSTVLPIMLEVLILRHLDRKDVGVERVGAFVAARIPTLTRLQKRGEICWLLFLCICLKAPIRAAAISELFDVEDSAIAILISDAKRLGLIQGSIDQSLWDRSLTADGLRSSMWLYSYESSLKNLNSSGSKAHVTADPYFGPMLALDIEFYRSGSAHMNRNALIARLRLERARQLIQQAAVEEDLAEDIDDFDVGVEEADESEDDFY
ncbi:RNA-directed DNA polymerase [Bradyrhizobium japonicum]|uniref:RNA-directed DNA polymerase n=1 Tax=Bradyrhizobium japonicum TaxID=375 RepID=UPI001BA43E33|nr:RNA-directed DNA polymerase [Bradyrhizobium japonicum]MBR0991899.1 RNA-directed DNA polymerase [Bradyrhizobium japonicum]